LIDWLIGSKFFSSDQLTSSFFSKIFWNRICQTWSKELENEDLRELYRAFSIVIFVSVSTSTFVSDLALTMSIHWSCYCTVHVYVILYFCESMWYFLVEANLYRFVIVYLYGLSMEIKLSRGSGWEPINPFNPPHFCALRKKKTTTYAEIKVFFLWSADFFFF
jgi:hypothetical protein